MFELFSLTKCCKAVVEGEVGNWRESTANIPPGLLTSTEYKLWQLTYLVKVSEVSSSFNDVAGSIEAIFSMSLLLTTNTQINKAKNLGKEDAYAFVWHRFATLVETWHTTSIVEIYNQNRLQPFLNKNVCVQMKAGLKYTYLRYVHIEIVNSRGIFQWLVWVVSTRECMILKRTDMKMTFRTTSKSTV